MRPTCPTCNRQLVIASGPPNARILVAGEFPGKNEIIEGRPFVGEAGRVLRRELTLAGIPPASCRMTNLWMHGKAEGELEWHFAEFIKELKGRRYLLLMGSDMARALGLHNVISWSGMEVRHPKFPRSVKSAVISPNPALLLQRDATIGEFRHAVRHLKELMDNE
jgi:uracil-DNA glycosylase